MSISPNASPETIAAVAQYFNANLLSKSITADQITVLSVRKVTNAVGFNAVVTYRVTAQRPVYAPGTQIVTDVQVVQSEKSAYVTTQDLRTVLLADCPIVGGLPKLTVSGTVTAASLANAIGIATSCEFTASDFVISNLTNNTAIIAASNTNMAFTGTAQVSF